MAEARSDFDQLDGGDNSERQLHPRLDFSFNENSELQLNEQQGSVENNPYKLPPPPREPHTKAFKTNPDDTVQSLSSNKSKVKDSLEVSNGQTSGSYPVYYNNGNGNVVVTTEDVTSSDQNKPRVIQTAVRFPQNGQHRWQGSERQRPLTAKRLRLLKIFGIIAAVVFFPLGIPAALFAFKAEIELHAGILKGNIDYAQKCAKRSERFIIFSWMFAILVAVVVFALVERSILSEEDKNSVRNRVLPP